MLMRVSAGIHAANYNPETKEGGDLDSVIETYNLMSQKW